MLIGPYVNGSAVIIGGLIGAMAGGKLPERVKTALPMTFGLCSVGLGITLVLKVKYMPAVVLAMVLGAFLGELLHLEKRIGSGKLVVITVISALLSGYVQHKFSGPWFGGLSGVVYALMGYVWLRGERDPQSGIYLQRGLITFALIWLIAGWFDLFGMSIANGAHVAGLAVGLAMAFADTLHARKRT